MSVRFDLLPHGGSSLQVQPTDWLHRRLPATDLHRFPWLHSLYLCKNINPKLDNTARVGPQPEAGRSGVHDRGKNPTCHRNAAPSVCRCFLRLLNVTKSKSNVATTSSWRMMHNLLFLMAVEGTRRTWFLWEEGGVLDLRFQAAFVVISSLRVFCMQTEVTNPNVYTP